MPPRRSGDGGFACLYGNRHFADGPRLLTLYRVTPRGDREIAHEVGTEARPDSGRLVWKVDKDLHAPGRYYVAFEEQQRISPYGPAECPEFSSRQVRLPQVPAQAGS